MSRPPRTTDAPAMNTIVRCEYCSGHGEHWGKDGPTICSMCLGKGAQDMTPADNIKRLADECCYEQIMDDSRNNYKKKKEALHAAIDSLAAEVEALRADAARLNWLERQDYNELSFSVIQDAPGDGNTVVQFAKGYGEGSDLRSAIDAAIRATP